MRPPPPPPSVNTWRGGGGGAGMSPLGGGVRRDWGGVLAVRPGGFPAGGASHGASCTPCNSLTSAISEGQVLPWCVTGLYKGSRTSPKHIVPPSTKHARKKNLALLAPWAPHHYLSTLERGGSHTGPGLGGGGGAHRTRPGRPPRPHGPKPSRPLVDSFTLHWMVYALFRSTSSARS